MRVLFACLMILTPLPLWAAGFDSADVVILGELHDNPGHHARQAGIIADLQPQAVVFEMLRPEEAADLNALDRREAVMAQAADRVRWSNMADYAAVLAASPRIIGAALGRGEARRAFSEGAAGVFGAQAQAYGLDQPLDAAEFETRKSLQFAAHCEAMPMEMMGGLVEAQRLRDAVFARAVLEALDRYGAPIVLITGNGHARKDWGVPAYLARLRPRLRVHALGQGEPGRPPRGVFDAEAQSAAPDRDDPCAAFE